MTQAAQLAQYGANNVGLSFKNRIINGDMVIAQRGTSFTGITNGSKAWPADRFNVLNADTVSVFSAAQVADAPAGFVNSIRAQVTTINATPNQETFIEQIIEGVNCEGIAYGTASAPPVTLSFWIKASIAGVYNVWIYSQSSAKSIGSSFTVTSANTWQFISLTFVGDTATALASNNGAGIYIRWYLDINSGGIGPLNSSWSSSNTNRMVSGSVRLASTLNATYQLTGVQFELGSTATSFDNRPYTTELALCQRYFCKTYNMDIVPGAGSNAGYPGSLRTAIQTTNSYTGLGPWSFPVYMRATPSMTVYNPQNGAVGGFVGDGTNYSSAVPFNPGQSGCSFYTNNVTIGTATFIAIAATAAAEL
jgi:hypothetical protein